jgi:predicted transposase YdaD
MNTDAGATDRTDYDQALKRLLSRAHDGFLALVAPGVTWRGELSPELPAVARQADLVWEVEHSDGRRGLLHIELQTKAEADIGERLAEYAIRLWRRERRPVLSVVVFLRPATRVPRSPFVIEWMGQERLRYEFDVLRLWEIPPERVLETTYYDLWPLATLMAGVTTETTLEVAERIAEAPVPAHERDELTRLLVLLAGLRQERRALVEALRRKPMIKDLWKESNLAGALEELAREEGEAQGRAKGQAEGRAEGRAEGMCRMAQVALEGRFGSLGEDVQIALRNADESTLSVLVAHFSTETIEQVRARLGLN